MAIETQNGYPSIRITAGERVLRKAAELVLYEGNPRRHGEKQMQALRRSLREFGFLRPLLIDRENRLVAGQAVLQAAMAEGMDVVPCILAEGLTAEQRRAYILADNRLAELAEWDRQALRVELQALNDLGFDLELTGFSLEALPFRLDGEPPAAEEDAEAPVQGRAPLESGRCYQLGRHRLYVGDATSPGALDALMDGAKARLLLTDPPYNVNLYGEAKPRSRTDGLRVLNDHWESEDAFEDFLTGALAGCAGHMEPGAAFYLWHASMHAVSAYHACARSGLGVRQQLIWVKQSFILGRQDYQWQHEPCLYGWKPGAGPPWRPVSNPGGRLMWQSWTPAMRRELRIAGGGWPERRPPPHKQKRGERMPGPRQSLEVLEGKGRKHLSRSERAQRAAGEVRPAPPKQLRAPEYLTAELKEQFRALARQLKELGLLSSLDYDTLARYLLARQSYLAATQEVIALQRGAERADGSRVIDTEALDVATRIQDRFFKQCRGCANDMGLTVTSRCRLVLPESARPPEENAFERLMREKRERMQRA